MLVFAVASPQLGQEGPSARGDVGNANCPTCRGWELPSQNGSGGPCCAQHCPLSCCIVEKSGSS